MDYGGIDCGVERCIGLFDIAGEFCMKMGRCFGWRKELLESFCGVYGFFTFAITTLANL